MVIDRQLSAIKVVESAHIAELKKAKDVLLKTKEGLLKTEDGLLKTKDGTSMNRKLLTHILTNVPKHPPTQTQTSALDDYNKLSLLLSLKIPGFWLYIPITNGMENLYKRKQNK